MSGAWVRGGLSVYDSPMQIMRLDTVVSTMDVCRELAADGAAELCAVVAREQTAGRACLAIWSAQGYRAIEIDGTHPL